MASSFTPILRRAVESVPGAVGAIFAARDGESVEHFARIDDEEIKIMGAHYGIILNHVQSVLHLFHFGEAEEIVVHHDRLDLFVRAVNEGYFIVLATSQGVHLANALRELRGAAQALKGEM